LIILLYIIYIIITLYIIYVDFGHLSRKLSKKLKNFYLWKNNAGAICPLVLTVVV